MRNSRRRRNISGTIAIAALIVVATTVPLQLKSSGPGPYFAAMYVSILTSLFSVVAWITFHLYLRWESQLERGDRLLAKWHVSAAEWALFRANDKARLDEGRQNTVKVRRECEQSGVDVIVAENALRVDNDFFTLSDVIGLQYLPETPPVLEYNMLSRTKSGSIRWNIRFPVATDANVGARAVWDYVYRPKPPVDFERRRRKWRIGRTVGLAMALGSFPLLVFGLTNRGNVQIQTVVLTCLIVGFIGVPFGLFLAWLTNHLLRNERKS